MRCESIHSKKESVSPPRAAYLAQVRDVFLLLFFYGLLFYSLYIKGL